MTEFEKLISGGLQEVESVVPDSIRIGAQDYPCVFSDIEAGDAAGLNGYTEDVTAVALIRKAVLSIAPKTGKVIFRGSKQYRVARVIDDRVEWQIQLEGLTQK